MIIEDGAGKKIQVLRAKNVTRIVAEKENKYWKDVADDGVEAAIAAALADEIEREVEKREGFVLWDMAEDMYLGTDDEGLTMDWDEEDFTLFTEEEIEGIQDLIYDSENTLSIAKLIRIHFHLGSISEGIRVVPCVLYAGEAPKLDFIKAYEFDWD